VNVQLARIAGRYAWSRLAGDADRFPAEQIHGRLRTVVDAEVLDDWLEAIPSGIRPEEPPGPDAVMGKLSGRERAEGGVYATPASVADGLAAAAAVEPGDRIVDLSAGTGALLAAAGRREPRVRLFGVECRPALAVVAAVRGLEAVGSSDRVRIWVGDGLARDVPWSELEGTADAVLANPPYLREKGRKEHFRRIRERHDHLAPYVGPRVDLAYLFVHRCLDYARAGGRLGFVTAAYWLTATGADRLRRDLLERARPLTFVRLPETSLFDDAPGHHSLLSVHERRGGDSLFEGSVSGATLERQPEDWSGVLKNLVDDAGDGTGVPGRVVEVPKAAFRAESWSPFSGRDVQEWGERLRRLGTPLEALVSDHQGFVSGADRVSARRLGMLDDPPEEMEAGDPGFLFEAGEVDGALERLRGTVLRPILRGRRLEPGEIWMEPPESEYVLYLDGELGADQEWVVEHLEPLRPALEMRREVEQGRMPWYRLHWPRDRADQTGPKLVVPRRAARPRFALDLSASAISSDCTYLVAPDAVDRPIRYLIRLMSALNRPAVLRYLRHFGKRKGETLEFYSDPLRRLPVPLRCDGGRLRWISELVDDGERRAAERWIEAALRAVEGGRSGGSGPLRPDPNAVGGACTHE